MEKELDFTEKCKRCKKIIKKYITQPEGGAVGLIQNGEFIPDLLIGDQTAKLFEILRLVKKSLNADIESNELSIYVANRAVFFLRLSEGEGENFWLISILGRDPESIKALRPILLEMSERISACLFNSALKRRKGTKRVKRRRKKREARGERGFS